MNSKKTWILTLICIITCFIIWAQTPPKIRRICKSGLDNNLYFYPTQDTCSKFYKYYIWVRNGTSGPFILLDSIPNQSASQYTHANANPGTTNPKWYYYIESVDSCPPDYNIYSDTESVDDMSPDTIYIDSASVDINTNLVHIGWRFNYAPDFYLFKLVSKTSTGQYIDLTNGGTRDTSWIDNNPGSNPSLRPIFYDLTSRDSCNNEQVFNINPHQTIFLQSKIDTCKKQVTLNWSAYMGWKTRKHYLYIKTGASFVELDSVDGNTFTYTLSAPLGQTIYYYVRAFRDTTAGTYSSASNVTSVTSRNRIDPQDLYLSDVTNNGAEHLQVSFILGSGEEARDFNIRRALKSNASYSIVATIPSDGLSYSWEDLSAINTTIYLYQITAINLCGQETALSNISNNIVLAVDGNEISNTLSWNKYFKWDTTVQLYRIYRANVFSNQPKTYTLLATAPDTDSIYVDDALPAEVGDQGICYYIEAIQSDGSPHGIKAVSTSNQACAIGNMIVWVPNAFHPEGVNKTFKPGGSYIDFVNSSLEIYNRWGGLIKQLTDLTVGWDGTDANNKQCPMDVYVYKMHVKGFDGKEQIKSGLVNLLR